MEQKITKEIIYKGKRFDVEKRIYESGEKAYEREFVDPKDAVCVACFYRGKIIMLKHYRESINDFMIELPAGIIEKGETAAQAAERELKEETGFSAKYIKSLGFIYPSCGYSCEKIHLFSAHGIYGEKEDDEELCDLIFMDLSEVKNMILKNEIVDAKTISTIFKL